jgi:predicted SnoaL-like aldol condensation-catalyzing enzyme
MRPEYEKRGAGAMSVKENKATERRMVEEALNKGNLSVVDESLTPDFIYHGPGGMEVKGREGYKKFLADLCTLYPDIKVTIEAIIAEGDMVATRNISVFTFKDKHITLAGSIMDRFEGGKIAETWELYDRLDLYRQMGIIPPEKPGQA